MCPQLRPSCRRHGLDRPCHVLRSPWHGSSDPWPCWGRVQSPQSAWRHRDGRPGGVERTIESAPESGNNLHHRGGPIHLEFGDAAGGASWQLQWTTNGGSYADFNVSAFKSTADSAFDWVLVTNGSPTSATSAAADLATVHIPGGFVGKTFLVRLRAYGTDNTYVETQIPLKINPGSICIIR